MLCTRGVKRNDEGWTHPDLDGVAVVLQLGLGSGTVCAGSSTLLVDLARLFAVIVRNPKMHAI